MSVDKVTGMSKARQTNQATSVAVLTFEVKGPGEFRVLPAGNFAARDGRPAITPDGKPTGIKHWHMDGRIAAALINQVNQGGIELVIDYEHQTLTGKEAPAAGWWKQLEWREGDGLYVVEPRWTARARAYIEAEEYKYISPVFDYDRTGAPTRLRHIAITNDPGLGFQDGLQAALSAKFSAAPTNQETDMDLLTRLLAVLKLNSTTNEEQAMAAVASLQARADQVPSLETQVTALKNATPDPAQYVPVATVTALQSELATLKNATVEREVEEEVTAGINAGKLLPAQEGWARDLGKSNLAALKSFIKDAPVVMKPGTQTENKEPGGGGGGDQLSASDLAVCKQLGIDPKEYAANKAA